MTLAEEFEAAAKELRDPDVIKSHISIWSMRPQPGTTAGIAWERGAEYGWQCAQSFADLLDRAAELARDNERVVQSIVKRDISK